MRKILIIIFVFSCVLANSQDAKKLFFAQNISPDTNTYVVIGTQTWMKYNLRVVKYNTGAGIPKVTDNTAWAALTTPAYCYYNNDSATNYPIYGALYNWYAVNTGNLCPSGTHVPDTSEFSTLVTYLGGTSIAGGHLKSVGTTYWESPNSGADNSSGYSALPGGFKYYNYGGTFSGQTGYSYFWTSTESAVYTAFTQILVYYNSGILTNQVSFNNGFSVRCIKN